MAICVETSLIWLYLIVLGLVVYYVLNQPVVTQERIVTINRPVSTVVESSPSSMPVTVSRPPIPINVPTQGFYGDFNLVGYLKPVKTEDSKNSSIERDSSQTALNKLHCRNCRHYSSVSDSNAQDNDRDNDHQKNPEYMLRLYGRQIDSNRYEYYTTNHWDPQIKISLRVPRDDQLTDGDHVRVPGYGLYRVTTYQPAYPGYI